MIQMVKRSKNFVMFKNMFDGEVSNYFNKNFPRDEYTGPVHYYTTDIPRNMFRSVLPVLLCKIFKKNKKFVMPIGSSTEIIFSIALLQDDIIDNDEVRQHMTSGWKKYGLPVSVASIDYCYYYAWKMLRQIEKFPIPEARKKMIYDSYMESQKKLYESFLFERFNKMNFKVTMKDILNLHECKTINGINALYCSSLAIGLPIPQCKKIRRYATLLGYAGQIKNDILDFQKLKGYDEYLKYSDIKRGYINYPIVRLFKIISKAEKQKVMKNIGKNNMANVKEVLGILESHGIADICIKDCKEFVSKAKQCISSFRRCREKNIFLEWADSHAKFSRSNWP